MKTISVFECSYCGTRYEEINDCNLCEDTHKQLVEIVRCNYVPYKLDRTGVPTFIEVKDSLGRVFRYTREYELKMVD